MYDPLTPLLVEAYQKELLKKVEQNRLAKAARSTGHGPWGWLLVRVGDALIAAGLRLHRRFEPAKSLNPQVMRSDCRETATTT